MKKRKEDLKELVLYTVSVSYTHLDVYKRQDSFLFSGRIDNVGKYYVKSLSYTIDGNVYNITLSDCGIRCV